MEHFISRRAAMKRRKAGVSLPRPLERLRRARLQALLVMARR